jgi:hypothetical protein
MESQVIVEMLQKEEKNLNSEELFISGIIYIKIILVLISILINILIIVIGLYRVGTKRYTDYIILFVSTSDLLFSLVTILFWSHGRLGLNFPILYNDYSCILWSVNDYATIFMNSFNMFELLFHFYGKIVNQTAQSTDKLSKKRLAYLVCSWIVKYLYALILSLFLIQNVSYQLVNCSINRSFVYYMLFDMKFFSIPLFYLVSINISLFLAYYFEKSCREALIITSDVKQKEKELIVELQPSSYINSNEKISVNKLSENLKFLLIKYQTFLIILFINVFLLFSLFIFQPFTYDKLIQIVYVFTYLFSSMNPLFILYFSAEYFQEFKSFFF